jgi:hypothetical protein
MRRRGILLAICGLFAAAAVRAELPPIDHPWPPDPALYDPPGTEVAPGLKVGDTLGAANAEKAKDLLPPEVLKHYAHDEYRNPIGSWPPGIIHWDRSFEEATRANAGRYDLDPETGTIVEKGTHRQPAYIYGLPFPTIDPADPQAGLKAEWNAIHNYWNTGSYHYLALLVWTRPHGVDRESMQDVTFAYYENQNPKYRYPNPENFSWQSLAVATTPADLQGTAALTYRYRDPKRRDAVWTYVPALRRVRAVSPSNRSDGFLGSDLSQDDGNFFEGKPEDFVWTTVGVREGFRLADADSIKGEGGPPRWSETGGWRDVWTKNRPAAGYQVPGWQGLAWAPANGVLTKTKFMVVNAVPRDRYYLYGRLELWIDMNSWIGAWNRKFSWKDELLNTYQVEGYLNTPARREGSSEVEWVWSSQEVWQCAEAVKLDRATLAGLRSGPDALFDRRVPLKVDQLFDIQTLNRFGK